MELFLFCFDENESHLFRRDALTRRRHRLGRRVEKEEEKKGWEAEEEEAAAAEEGREGAPAPVAAPAATPGAVFAAAVCAP